MRNLLLSGRPATSPEQSLWCGVIYQALKDAGRLHQLQDRYAERTASGKPMMPHLERDLNEARKAVAWLTKPSRDLAVVCEMAGIEMNSLLAQRELIESGELEAFKELIASNE